MLGQVGEHALEAVGHRVETGDEEEEADADHLVFGQPLPVDLGGDEHGQQVVGGLAPALFDGAAEVGLDPLGGRLLGVLDLVEVVAGRAQDAVLHLEEHVELGQGQSDQAEEHG